MPLPVFLDERGIAADILRAALTVPFLVLRPGSIRFLLLLVIAAKVIRVLQSPLLVGCAFADLLALQATASRLSFLEARIWDE